MRQRRRGFRAAGSRLGGCVRCVFPFADGLLSAANAGATAIIQPGGSIRDDEVIARQTKRGWQ